MQYILLVDDSAMIRRLIGSALESAGYVVATAVDGIDGLEKLASGPLPDVIVCDVRMPRMDGFEFLAAIQAKGVYRGPIVMLTSDGGADNMARAKALGARAWLSKPVKPEHLLSTVEKLAPLDTVN